MDEYKTKQIWYPLYPAAIGQGTREKANLLLSGHAAACFSSLQAGINTCLVPGMVCHGYGCKG